MAVIDCANPVHQSAVNQSEMLRQADEGAALTAFAIVGGFLGNDPIALAAALDAAAIAHYRRCVASALANGVDVGQYTTALQTLGTGGS